MTVTLTASARPLRRTLGPVAWAVLEELVFDAEPDPGGDLLVVTNVRLLAMNLGLSKDTVARALTRLIDAGHVRREGTDRSAGGRFAVGAYRIPATAMGGIFPGYPANGTIRRPSPPPRRTSGDVQRSLFDGPV